MMRTMAVSTVTPLLKSQPDVSKLNSFNGCQVTVTKHMAARNTPGQLVVPTQRMTVSQALDLQVSVPMKEGPGFYQFVVVDAGGSGEDTWMVKLGPEIPTQEFPMAGPNGAPPNGFAGAPAVPMDATAVTQILPGWYYNSQMGLLYTPWRETVAWNTGDPLPKPPAQAAHLSLVPPAATPWGQQPAMGGWGGYPVADDSKETIKRLEAKIVEDARTREMEALRADQRRQADETNARIEKTNQQFMTMFEKLMSTMADKPRGESPEVAAIKAQNETLQRRMDEERREREAERRDTQTREEIRRMKEDTDRTIAALTANKSDPMLHMIMQVMQQSNQGAMEAVKAIQSSTSTANTSAERQVQSLVEQLRSTIMTPLQLMEFSRASRGDGADMAKTMIETMKESSAMQREVYGQLLEVAGQGGNPPWVTAIEAIASKVGPIGEALANRASQPKVVERVVRVAVPVDPVTGQPIRVTPPPAGAPPAITGAPGAAPAPASTTPTEIRNTPQAEAAPEGKPKRGRKTAGKKKTAVPTAAETAKIPAGKGAGGALTIEQIRELDSDVLADAMSKFSDNVFFGDQLGTYVAQIRQRVNAGAASPEELGKFLLDQRNNLVAIDPMPPAVELFMAEQIEVLIERMIPEASDEYRERVVTIIEDAIEAEAEGDEDEA